MALKRKLTKDEHAKLPDALKAEYKADGDGFALDVDGDEDTGALKRAKDREVQLRKEAEEREAELKRQLDEMGSDDARKKGDIKTLEASWKSKNEADKADAKKKIDSLSSQLNKHLIDNVAQAMATKISKAPALLLPHIKARLQADLTGDEPLTRVLDAQGKVSALSLADLEAEFVANKDFSAIIVASRASGGAGKPALHGGGAPNGGFQNGNQNQPADLSKMNARDLAAHIKEKKAAEANQNA